MPRNFYFGKDASIVAGSASFSSQINLTPPTFGLVAAQATAFAGLDTTLQAAYTASTEKQTRTPVIVKAKDDAIKAMRANAILLSKIIYATPTVTDSQLVSLGLTPRSSRKPIPVLPTPPVVEVVTVNGRVVKIRVHDSATGGRGLPYGVKGANIYSYVGATPAEDPRQYHFEGMTTRATIDVLFPDSVASGATVWLSACWVSNRGETSVGSTPISFTLQGGPISAAA